MGVLICSSPIYRLPVMGLFAIKNFGDEVDSLSLLFGGDVDVDVGGDRDLAVAQDFLDHGSVDAETAEKRRAGVAGVVDTDNSDLGIFAHCLEGDCKTDGVNPDQGCALDV